MHFQRFTGRFKASLSGFCNHPSECSNLEAKQKICRTKTCSEEGGHNDFIGISSSTRLFLVGIDQLSICVELKARTGRE